MDIVEEFKKLGFDIMTRGWFWVWMKKGNTNIDLHEEFSFVDFENPVTSSHKRSIKVPNEMLLNLIKNGKESDIPTIEMPF